MSVAMVEHPFPHNRKNPDDAEFSQDLHVQFDEFQA